MSNIIADTIFLIGPPDEASRKAALARQDVLTKPRGSLGRLEELSAAIAGIRGTPRPEIRDKAIVVFAGDHGVLDEGIHTYPREVTAQMVLNFLDGGAGINVLSRLAGARVTVVDMGIATDYPKRQGLVVKAVGRGTGNIARGPAMSRRQAEEAVEAGIAVVEDEISRGLDLLGLGEMGIGNTTSSAAIAAVCTGLPASAVTGRGTGIDDAMLARKIAAVESALRVNAPDPDDGMDILARVGGFEIGGLVGAILRAAGGRVPVLVDGFIAAAAAVLAVKIAPSVRPYLIGAHTSAEAGHAGILKHLGIVPLLDLGMRLGEGTGAALAMPVVEAAVRLLNETATFDEAGVARQKNL